MFFSPIFGGYFREGQTPLTPHVFRWGQNFFMGGQEIEIGGQIFDPLTHLGEDAAQSKPPSVPTSLDYPYPITNECDAESICKTLMVDSDADGSRRVSKFSLFCVFRREQLVETPIFHCISMFDNFLVCSQLPDQKRNNRV